MLVYSFSKDTIKVIFKGEDIDGMGDITFKRALC